MLMIRILFVLLVFLQAKTCDEKSVNPKESNIENAAEMDEFESIKLEQYGGMLGHNEVMIIDRNTISYTFFNVPNPKPATKEISTPPALWNQLTQLYDEAQFRTLKNGNSHVVYDGMDQVFTIGSKSGELKVTNPLDDNADLKPFFELLNETRHDFYMKTVGE